MFIYYIYIYIYEKVERSFTATNKKNSQSIR